MSVTRSQLTGGPAYAAYNGKNIQFAEDSSVETALVTEVVEASLYDSVLEGRGPYSLTSAACHWR